MDLKSFESQFFNLPLELQENILKQRPELISRFSQISKEYNELMLPAWYNEFCMLPPTNKEIINYINSQPKYIGLVLDDYGLRVLNLRNNFLIGIRDDVTGIYKYHSYYFDNSQFVDEPITLNLDTSTIVNLIAISFDLVTQYNILVQRTPCIRYRPNYKNEFVKRYIMGRFDRATTDLDLNDSIGLEIMVEYLFFQGVFLNLTDINLYFDTFDVETDITQLKPRVIEYYNQIRNKLLNL